MRVFAAVLLSLGLTVAPAFAGNDANDAGKEDLPAAVSSATVTATKPAEAAKTETTVIENELEDLRGLVQSQTQELESQRAELKAQQLKMEALEEKLHPAEPTEPVNAPVAVSAATPTVTPTLSIDVPSAAAAVSPAVAAQDDNEKPSPLYFKIGAAEFFPLGFMDLTNVFRTTTIGTGIGTTFSSVPYANTQSGRLTEDRFSAQNSRIGLRTQAKFGDAMVTGYLEADFLGFLAPSGYETSNSNSLRMRLFWVDYKRSKIEILGGQSWSLLTPNRNGLSALPGDLFYSQDVDTNYQLGLTWARQAGVRVIVHPTNNWAIGMSIEDPEQDLPSSVTLPSGAGIPAAANSAAYNGQFDTLSGNPSSATNVGNTSVPNLAPDLIVKTSFDAVPGGHHVHFDVAGLLRSFKAINLVASTPSTNLTNANTQTTTMEGGGIAATANVELVKNLRFIATGFYSYGGGRYIANTGGPDLIIRPNGTLSGIHSGSGIGGFEYNPKPNTIIYGYYSGAYFGKNFDINNGVYSGYGFQTTASSSSANRYLYEPTVGIHQYLWRNANYGDIRIMTQFSYLSRAPWYVSLPTVAAPPNLKTAHDFMMFLDLRYDLP